MSRRRKPDTAAGPGVVELVEESVQLLRGASPDTLLVYYAGNAPFALGLLFFWAYTTWFAPTGVVLAWAALGLTGLFAAMKAAHAEFCGRLLAQRLGAEAPAWSGGRLWRLASAQLRWQAWGLVVLPLALVLGVPFGWVYAYFQNLSVLGAAEDAPAVARSQAALWPAQNHLALLIISALALCAWANVAAALWTLPWLANRVLGIENVFGLSGRWFINSTSLATVTVLSWLVVDPLVKAFYTLRVFHGLARRTGEDVRVELRTAQRARGARRATAALGLLLLVAGPVPRARAAEAIPPAVNPVQLDRAIDRTLAGSDFQWRLRPVPRAANPSEDGPIYRFIRAGGEWIWDLLQGIMRWLGRVLDWIGGWGKSTSSPSAQPATGMSGTVFNILIFLGIAVAAALVVWVTIAVWLRTRTITPRAKVARVQATAVPDLRDENTQAAQLPADGWLALAREQMARGEWRLALRALHLAMLARLAAEGLVSLAKFKTNLDYERELRRRALARQELTRQFAVRRCAFEAAWYGRAEAVEMEAREWLAELEQPLKP